MPRDFHETAPIRDGDGSRDERLVRLAHRQHGVACVGAAHRARLHPRSRAAPPRARAALPRAAAGVLRPTQPQRGRTDDGRALSCGPGAALSHRAAAAVWDLGPWPTGVRSTCRVTTEPRPRGRECGSTESRRSRSSPATAFRSPTPMRTLADVAGTEPRPRVERVFEQADRLGLLDVACARRRVRAVGAAALLNRADRGGTGGAPDPQRARASLPRPLPQPRPPPTQPERRPCTASRSTPTGRTRPRRRAGRLRLAPARRRCIRGRPRGATRSWRGTASACSASAGVRSGVSRRWSRRPWPRPRSRPRAARPPAARRRARSPRSARRAPCSSGMKPDFMPK